MPSSVRPFLLLISSSVSRRDPRYLHFFQLPSSLGTEYCSLFDAFSIKFQSFSLSGIIRLIIFISLICDLMKVISSAYLGSALTLCTSLLITHSRSDQNNSDL